ncbi:hypothetical protein [Caulobacter sp. 3R27C2-B]|uniref:hypothetical protein n=1 Tax=Caulobacter sp. 3R27C2-B TaxID=2502219 RepID=UPI0010F94491|nr:hypothetical protein [Caulobacter sp. 3R27C2-B]
MSKLSLDSAKVDVPCPQCGKKLTDTIGALRRKPQRNCRGCGVDFTIDTKQLDKDVRDLNRSLDKLFKF